MAHGVEQRRQVGPEKGELETMSKEPVSDQSRVIEEFTRSCGKGLHHTFSDFLS